MNSARGANHQKKKKQNAECKMWMWTWDHTAYFAGQEVMGLVHCSRDPQTSFFTQTFIKNGSHDTIRTFKNYFVILFSVFSFQFFSKISGIQTHP